MKQMKGKERASGAKPSVGAKGPSPEGVRERVDQLSRELDRAADAWRALRQRGSWIGRGEVQHEMLRQAIATGYVARQLSQLLFQHRRALADGSAKPTRP